MKRTRILIGVAVLVAVAVAWWLVRQRSASPPLVYQGQPIEHWFAQLPLTAVMPQGNPSVVRAQGIVKSAGQQYGNPNRSDDRAAAAFKAWGTNALPFLLARLQGVDSAGEKAVMKAGTKLGVSTLPFRNAELERMQAVTGLIQARELTPEAKALISSLRTNSNPRIAEAAAYVVTRRAAEGDAFLTGP